MAFALTDLIAPLAGGALIGLSAGMLRLGTGHIAGISGILRLGIRGPDRGWQLAFLAGLLAAGAAAAWHSGPALAAGLEKSSLPMVVAGGVLVGLGTGLGNGCTSGHGICGLARFSKRSLASVAIFMVTAALVVFLRRIGGGL
ncbi:YeeE/YedE family protein [Novosphingobium sp.]|uniref:YeeE/YedE family protein n=1 Tax=Novosphingobium sp. TaxID=1874826 RepID=UPI0035B12A1E